MDAFGPPTPERRMDIVNPRSSAAHGKGLASAPIGAYSQELRQYSVEIRGCGRESWRWWRAVALWGAPALAAQCGDSPEGFQAWLDDFKQVAINDGVSPDVVDEALSTATFDRSVLSHDRAQGSLQGGFANFAAKHIYPGPAQARQDACSRLRRAA